MTERHFFLRNALFLFRMRLQSCRLVIGGIREGKMRNRLPLLGIAMMGVAAVLFLGCFPAGTARADNIPYSLSVTPLAGGYVFEGNQHTTDRAVYGVSIGYNVTENWALEATYSAVPDATTTNSNQTGGLPGVAKRLTVHEVRGDVLYHFFPDQRLVPYLAAGGGIL